VPVGCDHIFMWGWWWLYPGDPWVGSSIWVIRSRQNKHLVCQSPTLLTLA